jgi:hypothetical protein
MNTIKLPEKVRGYRSRVINALIDYCKANTLITSPDLLINQTAAGTSTALRRPQLLPDMRPRRAFIAGNLTTGLGTKRYIRCNLGTATAVDHDGPMPNPMPPNEEWFDCESTYGDIHSTRA